jgi:hypothetical protein
MVIPSVKDYNEWNYLYEDNAFNAKMFLLDYTCRNCKNISAGGGASLCNVKNRVVLELRKTICKLYEKR